MSSTTTAAAAVAALAMHGIDTLYTVPGGHNDLLLDALGAPPDDHDHDDRFVAVVPAAVERVLSGEEHELIIRQSRHYIDQ